MIYRIIISKKDLASLAIYDALNKLGFKENIHVIQERSIEADDIDKKFPADFIIFASKHKADSLKKTLTVHNPGNWSKAELGGRSFNLPPSTAYVLKNAYLELKKLNNLNYEVSGEATHHGPSLSTPSLFIEIGSTQLEWKDENAAMVVAKTIVNLVKNPMPTNYKTAIGIGGNHYMPSFNKILERTNIALSYVCPKYQLEHLNENTLQQAIKNATGFVDFILLDWKGLGQYKDKVKKLAEETNLPIKKVNEVLESEEYKTRITNEIL